MNKIAWVRNITDLCKKEPFVACVLAVQVVMICSIIMNYGVCFQDAESVFNFIPGVLLTGRDFCPKDVISSFNIWELDNQWHRPRFLSSLFFIISAKTRFFLWKFFTPHPSFSPVWILTLFLSPFLLYKSLKAVLKDRFASFLGVFVYIFSCAYLYHITMFNHPGKPLLNLVIIALLYFLTRHENPSVTSGPTSTNLKFKPYVLRAVIPLLITAFFLDEMAIFCMLILPIWRPRYFLPYSLDINNIKTCLYNIIIYTIPVWIFLAVTLWGIPAITNHFYDKDFNFFAQMGNNTHFERFRFSLLLENFVTLISANLLPWKFTQLETPVPIDTQPVNNFLWIKIYCFAWVGIFFYIVRRSKEYYSTALRILTLLLVALFLQSFVLSFHYHPVIMNGYHYGTIFSIMFSFMVGFFVINLKNKIKFGKLLAMIFLCYVLFIQFSNFHIINTFWRRHSDQKAGNFFKIKIELLNQRKGHIIFFNQKKIRASLQCPRHGWYINNTSVVDAKKKKKLTESIWKNWKETNKCDLFTMEQDFMLAQSLWLVSELCPNEFSLYR